MSEEIPFLEKCKQFELGKRGKERFLADATKSKITNFKPARFKNEREAEKDFIEFVGFRGYYDPNGYPVIDLTHTSKTEELKDDAGKVIEIQELREYTYPYHPGQAHPPPIDENGIELGLLPHEFDGFRKTRRYLRKGIMFKWPRGFGKTYLVCWFIEWTMLRLGYPWLYLSETAIMNDVAYWVWQWATNQNLIVASSKGDKQNTYTQFELTTGAVLRIFQYMDEKSTGQHGYYMAMDDIIKKGWSDRPSDNDRAKRQWNSNLSYIKRKGLLIAGTCKFAGDPLEHLQTVIRELYIDVHTPYEMEGEFPDWDIKYDEDGKEILWVPELYTHEALNEKKSTIGLEEGIDPIIAWNAEMMQDTRPGSGGLCTTDDIFYTKRPLFDQDVQMVGIGGDLSWEENKTTSDMCAILSCVLHEICIDKIWYKRFTFIRSDVSRMPLYDDIDINGNPRKGVYTVIGEHFKYLRQNYGHIPLIIAIERNSGGMIIIKVAKREHFEWYQYIIPDRKAPVKFQKDGTTNIELGIVHSKSKVPRVFGELKNSIRAREEHKGHEVQFVWELEGTPLIKQMCGFPKQKHDDAPDAAGMIKDELNARYKVHGKPTLPRKIKEMLRLQSKAAEAFREMERPYEKTIKKVEAKQRRMLRSGRI